MNFFDKISLFIAKSSFRTYREDFYQDLRDSLLSQSSLSEYFMRQMTYAAKRKKRGEVMLYRLILNELGVETLAQTMKKYLPPDDVMIISVYESIGKLEEGLEFMCGRRKRITEINEILFKATLVPILIGHMIVVLFFYFGWKLFPLYNRIIPHERWAPDNQRLYIFSTFIYDYIFIIYPLFIGLLILFFWSITNWTGKKGGIRWILDHYYPYKIYTTIQSVSVLEMLAAMTSSGIGLRESIVRLHNQSVPWLRVRLAMALNKLEHIPDSPGEALGESNIFEEKTIGRLVEYSLRNNFSEAMVVISRSLSERLTSKISKAATIINNFIILLSGAILAYSLTVIYSIGYSIGGNLSLTAR